MIKKQMGCWRMPHCHKPRWVLCLAGIISILALPYAALALTLEPVVSGLALPVAITHAGDGSGRLFITQQGGQIRIFDGQQLLATPFLDISSLISSGGEQGLLSVAFHPSYAANGHFYVDYTNTAGNTVIARYTVSANPNVADSGSAVVLLTITQPFANHNGGQLQFGPDGYLYIGMGDGGSGGDPLNNGQNLGTLLGKMLRIDVDGGSPYAIPLDNPFVSNPSALDEIWAWGLRNPWRFSFDRATGDLFIADVGQASWEEVDVQPAGSAGGENYGWRLMEGMHCYDPPTNCNDGSLTLPIIEYDHSLGCSITGGYRYRGTQIPTLQGVYLYGDLCSGRIWGAHENGMGGWVTQELFDTVYTITTFGEDEAGEIYFAHYDATNGAIYRIAGVNTILHRYGALWDGINGWLLTTPPYYAGVDYARELESRIDNSFVILHKDGAIYDSAAGWVTTAPPYYPGSDYARDLELMSDGSFTILHQDGALWNSIAGWTFTTPPYYPGTDYARALELRADASYVILHRDGAIYDSASGWLLTSPPYHPGTAWAVDLKLDASGYWILHQDGAIWSTSGGWTLTAPPYYPGTDYARALQLMGSRYTILHRDGAMYDSVAGWITTAPPYYPGTNYAVDLEVR
jgi:glucose/arabinose dehydrogenase